MTLRNFVRDCWTVVIPLLIIILAVSVLFIAGAKDAAGAVSQLGTVVVLGGNVVYIAYRESR